MHTYLKNFIKYRYLMEQLIKKEIKLKYRSSVLGIIWAMLEPLLHMIVLSYVFQQILNKSIGPVYILIGRLLYSFFANATKATTKAIRKNSAIIKKVYVPKYIYTFSTIFANYIIFLISLIVLVPVAIFFHFYPSLHTLYALIPLFEILLISLGVGTILSTLSVFFKDLEYLWGVILMLLMYTSAIFYDVDRLFKSGNQWLLKINPVYAVICNFRNAVFGEPMDMYSLWYALIFGVVTFAIGIIMFWKKQDKFILYI